MIFIDFVFGAQVNAEDYSNTSFVVSGKETSNQYRVNLTKCTCGCQDWQQMDYPCRHAVACFRHAYSERPCPENLVCSDLWYTKYFGR